MVAAAEEAKPAAFRAGPRRWLLAVHRWLGLTLGLVLMSSGLSGALLVVAKPADRAWHATLHRAPGTVPQAHALDAAVLRLRAQFPRHELVLRLPREAGESLQVHVRGAWHGEVFIDPASGAELGRRGEREGFFNLLFEWHSSLLSDETGKRILFTAALAGVAMSIAGVVLWWPRTAARWHDALRVRLGGNATRAVLDLHRAGGALVALLLLAAIVSGMYMAWRPISSGLNSLAGFSAPPLPAVVLASGVGPASLSRLTEAANLALPGGRLSIVVLGAAADRPVRVRKQLPDEVHPNGLSSVWLHPQTAEVLAATHWRDGGPGLLGFEYLYPLHIGDLGGPAHRTATCVAGLALFLLGASGAWLWWRRGRRLL